MTLSQSSAVHKYNNSLFTFAHLTNDLFQCILCNFSVSYVICMCILVRFLVQL